MRQNPHVYVVLAAYRTWQQHHIEKSPSIRWGGNSHASSWKTQIAKRLRPSYRTASWKRTCLAVMAVMSCRGLSIHSFKHRRPAADLVRSTNPKTLKPSLLRPYARWKATVLASLYTPWRSRVIVRGNKHQLGNVCRAESTSISLV